MAIPKRNSVQARLLPVPPAPAVMPGPAPEQYRPAGDQLVMGEGRATQAVPMADARVPAPVPEQEQEGAVSRLLRGFNRGASQFQLDPTYNPVGVGLIGGASAIGAGQQDALERRRKALEPQQAIDMEIRKETARRQAGEPFEAARSEREHARALELARTKAANAPKAPAGFRFTANGDLEVIQGGPAAMKLSAQETAGQNAREAAKTHAQDVIGAADKAIGSIGFTTTGIPGQIMSNVAGSERKALEGYIDTLKSNLSFERLQEMRDNSKTGGALGNVSDTEVRLLGSTVAALDPNQPDAVLKQNIQRIKEKYLDIQKKLNAAGPAVAAGGAPAAGGGAQNPTHTYADGTVAEFVNGQWVRKQ